jgi:hypothetical protein
MSKYQQNKELTMKFELSILDLPNGKFKFVGSVPMALAFNFPEDVEDQADYANKQMMLPSKYRTIKSRTFSSREAAEAARTELGL